MPTIKMNLRLRPFLLLRATLVVVLTTFIAFAANAAIDEDEVIEDFRTPTSDLVELKLPVDTSSAYKERRGTHGFMFGLNYENVQFKDYVSIVDFNTTYYGMFGDSEFPIYNLLMSYKLNFVLGALTANAGIGYGTHSSEDSGTLHKLTVTKYNVSASYIVDNLFKEPYGAPYVSFGINQFNLDEKSGEVAISTGIEAAYFYSVGMLIQLNWLDQSVARDSLRDYGLENTYLDVYVSQFQSSQDGIDPNTQTEYNIGAGLKLEF
ncbi:MAG: hypothetical protein EOP06_09700 [Proteobacteria bacterium]|nr:MAG: hypothetical protein EOP06_09700 [Pseudomonadota bacterium]